jgi:hypothetical protein
VHHLVREHQAELVAPGAGDAEQHRGVGVVVPRHLLGVEVEQQAAELERVGKQAEQPVRRLETAHPVGRELLVQLGQEVPPHLVP